MLSNELRQKLIAKLSYSIWYSSNFLLRHKANEMSPERHVNWLTPKQFVHFLHKMIIKMPKFTSSCISALCPKNKTYLSQIQLILEAFKVIKLYFFKICQYTVVTHC